MKRYVTVVAVALAILVIPAKADSFSVSGTTFDGRSAAGSANFAIGANTLTVTLTNTLAETILGSSQVLVGVTWNGGPTGLTVGSGNWVVPTAILDCHTSTNSVSNCISGSGTSPYAWALDAPNGPNSVAVTVPNLFAGDGAGHPYGIVTTNIDGSSDGIRNLIHNPFLVGPVSFTLNYTNVGTTPISGVNLYFGTSGDHFTSVPDGSMTVMLLGGALVGLEVLRRRFSA